MRRGGMLGCIPLHLAQPDDAAARHLYVPKGGTFMVAQVTFMPSVGLYVVQRMQAAGQETFRVYQLPQKAPGTPFALREGDACTAEARNTATEALRELQTYFAQPNNAKPAMWTITPRAAKSGTWYDLAPGDPGVIGVLFACARVANATPDDIVAKGWDGALPPHLNYAAPFGLYIIRPEPANRPAPRSGP